MVSDVQRQHALSRTLHPPNIEFQKQLYGNQALCIHAFNLARLMALFDARVYSMRERYT